MDLAAASPSTLELLWRGGALQDDRMADTDPFTVSLSVVAQQPECEATTPQQVATFFSEDQQEEYPAIWKVSAASLPGLPQHLSHLSFRD